MERENLSKQVGELIRGGEIEAVKEILESVEGDLLVFNEIESLRQEVEPIEGWLKTKELAYQEIDNLPDDLLRQLLEKSKPFIDALPAGHSKGHLLRDAIHLSSILQDPKHQETDRVELLSGVLAGVFHDIGNAVVDRYHDSVRLAPHAEVGANTFRELAKGILPPNLSKLTELAIAGHTDYQNPEEVTRGNQTITRTPYEDEIIDGNKVSMWITRQTDRLDGRDISWIVRKILVNYKPIEDFSWETGFVPRWSSEREDFLHQFGTNRRGRDYLKSLPENALERRPNILETTEQHRITVYDASSPYNKYDSEYFKWVIMPTKVVRDTQFIMAVEDKPPRFSEEESAKRINKFLEVCKIIEPGPEIDRVVDILRDKFTDLPKDKRNQWARGLAVLTDELYPQWYEETKEQLRKNSIHSDPKLQEVVNELHNISKLALETFNPRNLNN